MCGNLANGKAEELELLLKQNKFETASPTSKYNPSASKRGTSS